MKRKSDREKIIALWICSISKLTSERNKNDFYISHINHGSNFLGSASIKQCFFYSETFHLLILTWNVIHSHVSWWIIALFVIRTRVLALFCLTNEHCLLYFISLGGVVQLLTMIENPFSRYGVHTTLLKGWVLYFSIVL